MSEVKKELRLDAPTSTENTPFTLLWVDKAGVALLQGSNAVFSEPVNGMTGQKVSEFESPETTGGGPSGEGADTTFGMI